MRRCVRRGGENVSVNHPGQQQQQLRQQQQQLAAAQPAASEVNEYGRPSSHRHQKIAPRVRRGRGGFQAADAATATRVFVAATNEQEVVQPLSCRVGAHELRTHVPSSCKRREGEKSTVWGDVIIIIGTQGKKNRRRRGRERGLYLDVVNRHRIFASAGSTKARLRPCGDTPGAQEAESLKEMGGEGPNANTCSGGAQWWNSSKRHAGEELRWSSREARRLRWNARYAPAMSDSLAC